MYQCISIVQAGKDSVDNVITAAKNLVELSRKEEGNLYYNLLRCEDHPETVILIEKWESKEAFLGHVAHADQEGDPVNSFGKVAEASSIAPSMIFNCEVLV